MTTHLRENEILPLSKQYMKINLSYIKDLNIQYGIKKFKKKITKISFKKVDLFDFMKINCYIGERCPTKISEEITSNL